MRRFHIEIDTTEETYKPIVLKRAIILCWVLLFICFFAKLIGANWFNIACNNQRFVAFCEWIDSNFILKAIVGITSSYLTYSLYYLAIIQRMWFSKRDVVIIAISIPIFVILRLLFIQNTILSLIFDITQFIVYPFLLERYCKCIEWFIPRVARAFCANILFQLISAITKNVRIKIWTDSMLIGIFFAIDVYFMLALYYLYSNNKKENKKMGFILSFLFNKSESSLKKMREKRIAKMEELQLEINEIDKQLELRKNEQK